VNSGPFERVEDNLEVKEVLVQGRRYVVCRNPFEVTKDAEAREGLVKKIEVALAHGPKQFVANKGFARFLTFQKGSVEINREAVAEDAQLDGAVCTKDEALALVHRKFPLPGAT